MKSWRRQAAIWQEGRLSRKIKKSKVLGKSSLASSRIQNKDRRVEKGSQLNRNSDQVWGDCIWVRTSGKDRYVMSLRGQSVL